MFFEVILSFRSKKFYIVSFVTCFLLAIAVKIIRPIYVGSNEFLDILLGSSPSFFYLFGLIAAIPVIKKDMEFTSYKKVALMITLGACVYESEQIWTARVFDFYDVVATLLAITIFLVIHSVKPSKT